MNAKPLAIGTVVGGITVFIVGMLIFSLSPLDVFYRYALTSDAAAGVARDAPLAWAVLVGSLSYAALVTLGVVVRRGPLTVIAGAQTGVVVGLLLWLAADWMLYGISTVGTLTSTLIGPLVESVPGAIAGGVIAGVLGRRSAHASPRVAQQAAG